MTATVARNTAGILIAGAGMSYGSNSQLLTTSEREAASYAESYTVYLCIGLCVFIGYMFRRCLVISINRRSSIPGIGNSHSNANSNARTVTVMQ